MILVNTPGSWEHVYTPLLHATWHGCTLTDLVFPFFLFIMGISMSLSMKKYVNGVKPDRKVYQKILKRTLLLFVFGLFLNAFPLFDFATLRLPGVLQRIAIVFIINATILLNTKWNTWIILSGLILIGYWLIYLFIPVPGTGYIGYEKGVNIAAWLDEQILAGHMWSVTGTWDPEGILSTLPSIVSTLLGAILGNYFFNMSGNENLKKLIILSIAITIIGWLWSFLFPLNKNLWSSSFVLFTSGLGALSWFVIYWIMDVKNWQWVLFVPFKKFGLNAILSYMLSILLVQILYMIPIGEFSFYTFVYERLFNSWLEPKLASLFFGLVYIALIYIPVYMLDRKRIYLKV